jgi:hypothetical protein
MQSPNAGLALRRIIRTGRSGKDRWGWRGAKTPLAHLPIQVLLAIVHLSSARLAVPACSRGKAPHVETMNLSSCCRKF